MVYVKLKNKFLRDVQEKNGIRKVLWCERKCLAKPFADKDEAEAFLYVADIHNVVRIVP